MLRTAPGVGPVEATCYVLTMGNPEAMETNRQDGAYSASDAASNNMVTATRNAALPRRATAYLRSLLVQSLKNFWAACPQTESRTRWGCSLVPGRQAR